MTVAIVKTKFASHIRVFEADKEDNNAEEMDKDIQAMTKQHNHKTQTVNCAYANQTGAVFSNVWDGVIQIGLQALTLWQDFWGVDTILCSSKRVRDEAKLQLVKQVAQGIY